MTYHAGISKGMRVDFHLAQLQKYNERFSSNLDDHQHSCNGIRMRKNYDSRASPRLENRIEPYIKREKHNSKKELNQNLRKP